MTHEELYALWSKAEEAVAALEEARMSASRAAAKLELRLYEMEGRGHLAHAQWIRVWLGIEEGSCAEILASEQYDAECKARFDSPAGLHTAPAANAAPVPEAA